MSISRQVRHNNGVEWRIVMRHYLVLFFMLFAVSCGGDTADEISIPQATALEAMLAENTSWPYEIAGIFDIVEAGDFDDSGYPGFAIGALTTEDDDWGVSITIGAAVVADAGIDIDSGNNVTVWLQQPTKQFGVNTYPVARIDIQQ